MKKIFFISGMPRSGSSLLCALLSQNPNLYVSGTSGILDMMLNVRNYWPKIVAFNALDPKISNTRRVSTLRGMLNGYYEDVEQPIVIDKCRQWPAHLEMAQAVLGYTPKCIITVRDVRDVLASFERKWRETKKDTQVSQEEFNQVEYETVEGRCNVLAMKNQILGSAVNSIRDAVHRGWRKSMLFVEYDELCLNPKDTLAKIYSFLEFEGFNHNTKNVEQKVVERDEVYGWKDLHAIRAVIQPQEPQYPIYLPKYVSDRYAPEAFFWRELK